MTISENDIDNLRHMVGAGAEVKRRDRGYRNYYNTYTGDPEMQRLVEQGLAVHGRNVPGNSVNYHATRLGCLAAGLSEAEIRRAMPEPSPTGRSTAPADAPL